MNNKYVGRWLPLRAAANYIGASPDTILRRAIPYDQDHPDAWVRHRIRWKYLELGENTRRDRRYLVDDLERLLVPA